MKNGLYEVPLLIEKDTKQHLHIEKIEQSEMPKILAKDYQVLLRKKLESLDKEEVMPFYGSLFSLLENNDTEIQKDLLIGSHDDQDELKNLLENRPHTSIAFSSLFTGKKGEPQLVHELKREIRTSDKIDLLISFIKFSGLRLIYDDLVEFTKANKLRVITTSYMGASDYKAIEKLSRLPNTQVKVTFDVERTRLHAKAYYFQRETGFSTAYIGSSNLSRAAISSGLEWNVKISEYTSPDVMHKFQGIFDSYWNDNEFIEFDPEDVKHQDRLKEALTKTIETRNLQFFDLRPYPYQQEILDELEVERTLYHSQKNLIVAATGTGKTMVAAFDYKRMLKNKDKVKILFIAHRKEILEQSMTTFRMVLKDQNFGDMWDKDHKPRQFDHVFATVQTLTKGDKYLQFREDHFDYIVLDETHHASASTYLKLIEYFTPEILLGLTATPERMDGEDITSHFNGRIASEIRLTEAINRKLLSPFHYFGVTDAVDLDHMQFKRGKYDQTALTNLYTKDDQRVSNILESMDKYITDINEMKALGFCVNQKHAEYMAQKFNRVGIPSINLDAYSDNETRTLAKARLNSGEIKCIFVVDLYNEGVDIPAVDTVLFLRPTESLTVFLQQLGRGLRLHEDKDALTVLDFVGRAHKDYDFSMKFRSLIGKSKNSLKKEIENEFPNMPAGCSIQLERVASHYILDNINSSYFNRNSLRKMIIMFKEHFELELTLENFLDMYHLDSKAFYGAYTFYELCYEAGVINTYHGEKSFKKTFLRRLSTTNSRDFLLFIKEALMTGTLADHQMTDMLHYTLYTDKPEISYKDSVDHFMAKNQTLCKEAIELIDYNLKHTKLLKKRIKLSYDLPLNLYGDYHLDQILAGLGVNKEDHKYPLRQGVFYVKEKHTDVFFITINKMEGDYLESTMYNDYAISNELFHWESQSTTSVTSATGKRYIEDRSEDHVVLLFVREAKKQHKSTMPYTFLGRGRYVSHKGSKPIQMVWKLDEGIPQRIVRENGLRLVE